MKVYKDADYQDNEHNRLKFDMKFPILKNVDGEVIKPANIMLHNNETQMIFSDAQDASQIFNFDMEKGQIVEQFTADSKHVDLAKMRHMTNKVKNGQASAEATFVGINERAIYTMDTRVNKKEKAVQSKVYKTNPNFSKLSTTFAGGLAIGSLSGEIRLYKEVG